jgi:mannose-6-phosphate isomerase-like protein (cupin superfamily)
MKRRNLIQMAGLNAMAMFGVQAASLPNTVISDTKAKLTKEPFGDLRIFFDGPTEQLKSMTAGSLKLNAGATPHAPHQHPEEEFMVITEGTGEIVVDGKKSNVGPGSMMYCAAGKLHGIVNTGKTPLLFYFYKWRA